MPILTTDTPTSDPSIVSCLCFDTSSVLSLNSYVIIPSRDRKNYFGQVISPQVNLAKGTNSPHNPIFIEQLRLVEEGEWGVDQVVNTYAQVQIEIIAEYVQTGDKVEVKAPRLRPIAGSLVSTPSSELVNLILRLAEGDDRHHIGDLIDNNVPLYIRSSRLRTHMLMAGTTGSGKSNAVASVIAAIQQLGYCTIIQDYKPDYQDISSPNDELPISDPRRRGLDHVEYWQLGGRLDRSISVRPSELNPDALAYSVFFHSTENQQAETLGSVIRYFNQRTREKKQEWGTEDLLLWVRNNQPEAGGREVPQSVISALGYEPNLMNWATVCRKLIQNPNRWADWIWRGNQGGSGTNASFLSQSNNIFSSVQPGKILSIHIDNENYSGRHYALFLDWFINQINNRKKKSYDFPICHVIDEAQDIFSSEDRNMSGSTTARLVRAMRKSRSLEIRFIYSVQSAAEIPSDMMQNLNNRVIMKHLDYHQARAALPGLTDSQMRLLERMEAGEAFVMMNGARAIVHAKMLQSPFNLTRFENSNDDAELDYVLPVEDPTSLLFGDRNNGR